MLVHDFLCGSMGIPKHLSTLRRRVFTEQPRLALKLVAAGFDLSLAVFSNCRFLDLFRVFIGLFSLVFVGKLALYFGFQPLANRPVCADQARSCVRPPECRSLGMRSNCAAFSNTLHRGASSSPLWWWTVMEIHNRGNMAVWEPGKRVCGWEPVHRRMAEGT